jgi:hypothetical protein
MGFRSRPDIEAEVVSTCRLQPFVSKQRLDVPDWAPVKQRASWPPCAGAHCAVTVFLRRASRTNRLKAAFTAS